MIVIQNQDQKTNETAPRQITSRPITSKSDDAVAARNLQANIQKQRSLSSQPSTAKDIVKSPITKEKLLPVEPGISLDDFLM